MSFRFDLSEDEETPSEVFPGVADLAAQLPSSASDEFKSTEEGPEGVPSDDQPLPQPVRRLRPDWAELRTIAGLQLGDNEDRLRFGRGQATAIRKRWFLGEQTALHDVVAQLDVLPAVYEGGFKLWECAVDLLEVLHDGLEATAGDSPEQGLKPLGFGGLRTLDLGCGHGLPGIFCLQRGAESAVFQDLNEHVLEHVTAHNLLLNLGALSRLRPRPVPPTVPDSDGDDGDSEDPREDEGGEREPEGCASEAATEEAKESQEGGGAKRSAEQLSGQQPSQEPDWQPLEGVETDAEPETLVALVSGDWRAPGMAQVLNLSRPDAEADNLAPPEEFARQPAVGTFDLILSSDCLYNAQVVPTLYRLILDLLRRAPKARALIGAKRYYFGVGGGTHALTQLVEAEGKLRCRSLRSFADGRSNIRDVIELRWAEDQLDPSRPQE